MKSKVMKVAKIHGTNKNAFLRITPFGESPEGKILIDHSDCCRSPIRNHNMTGNKNEYVDQFIKAKKMSKNVLEVVRKCAVNKTIPRAYKEA